MWGKGEFIWPDGRKYVGEYVNDKKEGFGILELSNGRKYEGNWYNGMQQGKGLYIGANQIKIEGEWNEGKLIKKN